MGCGALVTPVQQRRTQLLLRHYSVLYILVCFGLNYVFVFFVGFAPNVFSSRLSVFCLFDLFVPGKVLFTVSNTRSLILKITGALENLFCLWDKDNNQAPHFSRRSPPGAGCIQILDVDTGLLAHTLRSHPSIFLKTFVFFMISNVGGFWSESCVKAKLKSRETVSFCCNAIAEVMKAKT